MSRESSVCRTWQMCPAQNLFFVLISSTALVEGVKSPPVEKDDLAPLIRYHMPYSRLVSALSSVS